MKRHAVAPSELKIKDLGEILLPALRFPMGRTEGKNGSFLL